MDNGGFFFFLVSASNPFAKTIIASKILLVRLDGNAGLRVAGLRVAVFVRLRSFMMESPDQSVTVLDKI